MRLDEEFDVASLPKSENNFEPLPEGWYDVSIAGCEVKETKAGNGKYLKMKYEVKGPTHANRVVFGNLNIRNSNPKAEEIGRRQLSELLQAIGLAKLTDTDQMLGHGLKVKLAIREDAEYGASNDVKGFKSSGNAPLAPAAPAKTARPTPPWAKK